MTGAGDAYLGALEADEAELAATGIDEHPSIYATQLARAAWGAAVQLDRTDRLTPMAARWVVDAVRAAGRVPAHEDAPASWPAGREILALALVRLLWGPAVESAASDADEDAVRGLMGAVLLAAADAARESDDRILRSWTAALQRQENNLRLGPGWARRVNGLDVPLDSAPVAEPGTIAKIEVDNLIAVAKRIGTASQARALVKRIAGEPLTNSERQALHRLRTQLKKII